MPSQHEGTKVTIAKVLEWLGALPLLILSVGVVGLTLTDRLKVADWDVLPELPPGASGSDEILYEFVKLLMLFVGLVSASIATDRLLHFNRLDRKMDRLGVSIEELMRGQEATVHILPDRSTWYSAFLSLLAEAPPGATVFVTSYEKLKMSYDSGEGSAERELMELWDQKLRSGDIRVEQLVHVATVQDLESAWQRVHSYADLPNFTITAVIGVSPEPLVEYGVVGNRSVITGFSTSTGSPYAVEAGHLIRSEVLADRVLTHGRLWASAFGKPLKTRDSIQEGNYRELARLLPRDHSLDLPPDLAMTALRLARDKEFYSMVQSINESRESLEESTQEFLIQRSRTLLQSFVAEISDVSNGRVRLSGDGLRHLYTLLRSSRLEILAVCPQGTLDFWRTQAGETFNREISLATSRGVQVSRIFCLETSADSLHPELTDLMQRQKDGGVDVFVASGAPTPFAARDFMIIDKSIIFEDRHGGVEGQSLVLISQALSREYHEAWEFLAQYAEPWTPT